MIAVASIKKTGSFKSLVEAVKQEKWSVAFLLARRLNRRRDLSQTEIQALRFLVRRAALFVTLNLRSGKRAEAKTVLASLRKLTSESRHHRLGLRLPGVPHFAPGILKLASSELEQLNRQIATLKKLKERTAERSRTLRSAHGAEPHRGERGGRRSSGPAKKVPWSAVKSEQIERIPHMEIRPASVERFFEVSVFANTTAADPGTVVEPLQMRVPKRVLQFKVHVSFRCSPHFRIEGLDHASLVFWRSRADSTVEKFIVSVAEPDHPGPMFFVALFHYNRRPSGKLTLFVVYDRTTKRITSTAPPGPKNPSNDDHKLPNDVATSRLAIDFKANPSDIRIEVLKTPADDGRTFELRCYTPAGDWKGPWILPHESDKFVKMQMADFVDAQGQESLATLQGAGIQFWNSVTKGARDVLTSAFHKHQIETISVLSEEPFVPWELMIPVDVGEPPVACLGVTYSIGRWITGDFRSPTQFIPMRTAFIVAPERSGLAVAPKEAAFLSKKLPGSSQIKPVSFSKLNNGLKSSKHDIVHFICHGEATGTPILKLDPNDVISSTQVIALAGFLAALGRHPFIFLNSCEVGQAVRTLAGLGGFPNAFLRMGAAAVVAPLWSVDDVVAEKVCKLFYKHVLSGKSLGEAMKSIRAQAFDSGTDTFASYCYYGDPRATAVRKTRTR
jgi:hypothetical protein